jgi:predicted ferric reductase
MALGRLAGFTGAYLMLIMVVLIARVPWLERSVGQDRLLRWHRRVAPFAVWLIVAHVLFITLGYAAAARTGVFHQLWVLVTQYADLLAAAVAFGLLVMAGISSIKKARRRLKYETWWAVHLYLYLALALAFAHQIATGLSFRGHPLTRGVWIALWAGAAALVLACRVALPVWRSLRHRLEIVSVTEEAPNVFSVICRGRDLDRLEVSGGQFFQWRFLARGLWWQAHPYSLSALPRPPFLRFTVKGLGDQGREIAALKRGTRVAIEGPYGTFTHHARTSDKVLLVAAGVGITPLRALLEELPPKVDVVAVVRASSRAELVHHDEVVALVEQRGGRLHELIGPRSEVRLDARMLRRLVPDVATRDIYVCGPESFSVALETAARKLGVHGDRIHREEFSF